jgi:hypothetical protein
VTNLPSVDWTKVKDAATTASLVFGVAWAFWTWGFAEWLRKRKLLPALDGKVEAEAIAEMGSMMLTTIKFAWRNKGGVPIYIDTKRSVFTVYEVNCKDVRGVIGSDSLKSDFLTPILQAFPLEDSTFYFLEPDTESPIHISVMLDSARVYMAQIKLFVDGIHHPPSLLWNRSVTFRTSRATGH